MTFDAACRSAAGAGFHLLSGGDEAFNPLQISDTALLFWTAIIFFLLLFLLTKFVWGPLMKTVDAREARIKGDIEKAETARAEAERTAEAHTKELEKAAQNARSLLDEAEARATKLRSTLEAEARQAADALLLKARAQIQAEKAQALQEIRDQVVDLSVEISRRIASRPVDREDHLREADALLPQIRGLS